MTASLFERLARHAARLRGDRSGLALVEFVLSLPVVLAAGLYGAESANLALCNLRISQIALNLADNASRVGVTPLATEQLREVDINDILQAARYQGRGIGLTANGRITISSLENVQQNYDTAPVQRIHWQRCVGLRGVPAADAKYNSGYTTSITAGTDSTQANAGTVQANGLVDPDNPTQAAIKAPSGSGVIFVELNYNYQPLISGYFVDRTLRIHYIASFVVRDNRDFSQIYNFGSGSVTQRSTCNKYTL